ncbi:hypothetical protein DBR06_SOUSAS6910282, partial [Sousa chinensis]
VQAGSAHWELHCRDHGLQPDARMPSDNPAGGGATPPSTFFSE